MVAGRDSGGGASIQADLKTFHTFGEERSISADVYDLLRVADGRRPFEELLREQGISCAERMQRALAEMAELWSSRAVVLRPASGSHSTEPAWRAS